MGRQLTQEEVLAVLEPMHPTIDFRSFVYVNTRTKSRAVCKTCKYRWEPTPKRLKNGHGCPKCSAVRRASRRRLTQEEVLAVLEPMHPTINFSEFVYAGAHAKSRASCRVCGHTWGVRANSLKGGSGCPRCRTGTVKLTQEEALDALVRIHPAINFSKLVYEGSRSRVCVSCETCGNNWEPTYQNLQKGSGCPKCAKVTQEKALDALVRIHPAINFSKLVYEGAHSKVCVSCETCGNNWRPAYNSLKKGHGCPKCASSRGEKRVAEILDSRGISYETEVTLKGTRLRFDFFIPSLNVAIEVQGLQHYFAVDYFGGIKAFRKAIECDRRKRQWCKDNGVKLITIPYLNQDVSKFEQYLRNVWARDEDLNHSLVCF